MSGISNNKISKFNIYDMVTIGVMAAIIFTITYFVRIPIPTPVGETNLKLANAFCLLAGILFGGLRGGLAAGIGSVIFDLLNPLYITSAPFTLAFFFLMAFICGVIVNKKGKPITLKRIILGASCGAVSYFLLYITKSVISRTIETTGFGAILFSQTGLEAFKASVVANSVKMVTSGTNVIIAVVITSLIAFPLRYALERVGFYQKISLKK